MADKQPDWQDAPKDRRSFIRVPVAVPAMLMSTALGRVGATLTDLSQAGCRLETRARCRPGDHFVLKIGTIAPKCVVTSWSREGEVGLAFDQLLAWPIVSAIAFGPDGVGPAA